MTNLTNNMKFWISNIVSESVKLYLALDGFPPLTSAHLALFLGPFHDINLNVSVNQL